MPEVLVRGVSIHFETIGSSGPWIALTPGSRRPYDELIDLSRTIARSGYRVLLHDRRNCGASEVAFDSSASEHEIWADDLYALGQILGAWGRSEPILVEAQPDKRIEIEVSNTRGSGLWSNTFGSGSYLTLKQLA